MVFTAKNVELPNFGERLKKLREEADFSIQRAAHLLNIHIKYLECLESGEIGKLPADVYNKGFLRRYAKLLDADPEALVEEYEKEARIAKHLSQEKVHRALPYLRSRRFTITPRFFTAVLGLFILLAIGGYLFYQLHFLISPPRLSIFEPAEDLATSQAALTIKGQAEQGAQLTINGQVTYIDKDGNFTQSVNLIQGLNTIKIEATNRFGKSRSVVRQIMLQGNQQ